MTQVLLHTQLTDKQRRFVEIVDKSGITLLDVVNDILDFSKIEAGKLQLENSDFDLQELIGEVMDLFAHRVQSKQVELASNILDGVPTHLRGDVTRLRQNPRESHGECRQVHRTGGNCAVGISR